MNETVSMLRWSRAKSEPGHFGQRFWEVRADDSPSRETTIALRSDQQKSPGWSITLGCANPERDVSLYEVLALLPRDGAVDITRELVEAHLDVIQEVTQSIIVYGLNSTHTITRDRTDRLATRMRDLVRLRREALYARMEMRADSELPEVIQRRLAEVPQPSGVGSPR